MIKVFLLLFYIISNNKPFFCSRFLPHNIQNLQKYFHVPYDVILESKLNIPLLFWSLNEILRLFRRGKPHIIFLQKISFTIFPRNYSEWTILNRLAKSHFIYPLQFSRYDVRHSTNHPKKLFIKESNMIFKFKDIFTPPHGISNLYVFLLLFYIITTHTL